MCMGPWIDRQAKGCRRITVFDALFEQAGDAVDLLLTDQSAVIAYGLRQALDVFRCVELCAGLSCSSQGLESSSLLASVMCAAWSGVSLMSIFIVPLIPVFLLSMVTSVTHLA